MKILHLYSDWRWTGPAEPAMQMCWGLRQRGHEVVFAHPPCPPYEGGNTVATKAAEWNLQTTTRFALDRYVHPLPTWRDLVGLPKFLRQEAFDVVHMHLCHDHAIGGWCARRLGKKAPLLVRTLHRRDVLPATLLYRYQIRSLTDGWLTFTDSFRDEYIRRYRLPPERVAVQPMTVDLDRFHPDKPWKDMRAEFNLAPGTPLIGIVGRFQKYRRMDVFLEAAALTLKAFPEVRFFVIGRSSKIQETVVKPAQQLGIADRVILTGYRRGDYGDTLASLDIFSLLMPGFDGTARAVREAMALAKPCVVSDFGMLPDIVPHEKAGLVTKHLDAESLANGWLDLLRNPQKRQVLGAEARRQVETRFRLEAVGPALEAFYAGLLAACGRRPGS